MIWVIGVKREYAVFNSPLLKRISAIGTCIFCVPKLMKFKRKGEITYAGCREEST